MNTSPNMGLKVWNLTTDPYNHDQLAQNWAIVDEHDHSGNKGKQIPSGGIADGAITQVKFAPGVSLPAASISAGQVGTTELANDSVTTGKILDGTILNADVSLAAAIAYSKLSLAGSIVDADVSAGAAIDGDKIAAGTAFTALTAGANITLDVGTGVGVRRDLASVGRLQGTVTATATKTLLSTIATIPVGFRPSRSQLGAITMELAAGVYAPAYVLIDNSGSILIGGGGLTNGHTLYLDGITYAI